MSEMSPDYSGYATQTEIANNHTEKLVGGVAALALGLGQVRVVMHGAAADFQQMSVGMAASARVTGQSYKTLSDATRSLSRDFPVATKEALQTVQAVQSLGLTAKGQEAQVRALSVVMTRLAGATGEFGPAVAQSFGQLNRQMASLDPARVARFGDSLTTLAARSGARAGDILQFSKAIAPMAQAAGIGETGVLGMSTAFAKLGEDGFVASNTVNKMLSDLNRSVRDGSNDMAAYANVVGVTREQFEKLYKADPGKAVSQVFSAVARAGPQGQRELEQLGIEGVRGQRVALEIAQQGGISRDINTAIGAYGSGSTKSAADVAFGTAHDSMLRLSNATVQVAEAFERPLLGSVTNIVNAVGGLTRGVGHVVESSPVQHILGVGAQLALPLLLARGAGRIIGASAFGAYLARSGPVAGAGLGLRVGRAGSYEAAYNRAEGNAALQRRIADASYGPSMMGLGSAGSFNFRMSQLGSGVGALFPHGPGGGYGLRQMIRDSPHMAGAGLGAYFRMQAETARLAREDPFNRQMGMRPYGNAYAQFADTRRWLQAGRNAGTITGSEYREQIGHAFRSLREDVTQTGAAMHGAGQAVRGFGNVVYQNARFAAWGGRQVGGAAMGALGGIARSIGPIGGVMIAGGLAHSLYSYGHQQEQARREHVENLDMFATTNAYRDATGQAGEASLTLSQQMQAAAETISASVHSIHQATQVTDADRAAAEQNRNVVQRYSGTTSQVASQIAAINVGGLKPADLQGAKLDLLRLQQSGDLPANFDIDAALTGASTMGGGLSGTQISGMVQGMAAAPGLGDVNGLSLGAIHQRMQRAGGMHIGASGIGFHNSLWGRLGHTGSGAPVLGKTAGGELDTLQGALMQQFQTAAPRYGAQYAAGQELKSANQAIQAAIKTGNADLVVGMEQQLTETLTGKKGGVRGLSAADIQKYGSLGNLLADKGLTVAGQQVNTLTAVHGRPITVEDSVARDLSGHYATAGIAKFFSNFSQAGFDPGRKALAASANAPEDLQKQHDAVMAIVDSGTKAGMTLGQLASQAAKSTASMADSDARRAVMAQVVTETTRRLNISLGGMNLAQQFTARADYATNLANTRGNTPEAQQARQMGQEQAAGLINDQRSWMQQRLMAQFNFEKQSKRGWEDYYLAVGRANEDFQRSMSYAEDDFQRQRSRQFRDFNIQRTRQAEDAAKQMYDPYTRIATQPTWDAWNLAANSQTQINAMRQQIHNIRRLRDLGLTEASIQMLKLYDPNNAQQTQQLVYDLESDSHIAGQLNRQTRERTNLAGQLLSEDPSFKRQTQDFRRALRDSERDYQIARDRQEGEFHRSMSRQATDWQTQLNRMQTDLTDGDRQLTNDMGELHHDMIRLMNGQALDWKHHLTNTMRDTLASVQHWSGRLTSAYQAGMNPNSGGGSGDIGGGSGINATGGQSGGGYGSSPVGGQSGHDTTINTPGMHKTLGSTGTAPTHYVNPNTGTVYTGGDRYNGGKGAHDYRPDARFIARHKADPGFNKSIARSMRPDWATGDEWHAWETLWNNESGWNQYADNAGSDAYGIPQALPADKMADVGQGGGKDWRTNPATQIRWGAHYIASRYGSPHNALAAWNSRHPHWYAEGGIATAPHIGVMAEAGNEAVIPLNEHGVGFLARALGTYLTDHDAAMITGGGGRAYALHIDNSTHVYDQRVDFSGSRVEVKANSPRELGESLESKRRSDNLTGTRGVAWRKS